MKSKFILILLPFISVMITAELISYAYFRFFMNEGLKGSVYFIIHGPNIWQEQPIIKPYLWSNYAPNPKSPKVNQYGWRYGGCPKGENFRILCLGGSTTWSDRASSPEKSYPAQLEKYLQNLGYKIDVVNGGVPYYTSAEELGTLAFRGIYTESDLVLIHSGGNDIYPFMSPQEYKPDYSHWRTVEEGYNNLSRNDLFRVAWRIPSWTWRIFAIQKLKPDFLMRAMISKELTSCTDILLATNDFTTRHPIGLENNLRSMLAISKFHGADVVNILFNQQSDRFHIFLLPLLKNDPKKYQEVRKRADFAIGVSNKTIQKVSDELGVPVIPFDKFVPRDINFWQDQCHLNDEGIQEKAVFIGKWLIENNILKKEPILKGNNNAMSK